MCYTDLVPNRMSVHLVAVAAVIVVASTDDGAANATHTMLVCSEL